MSTPFVGEIRLFGGNFAPQGWAFCDGQLLAIADPDNDTLFRLIGTTYGGDGQSTFALPDLRGRIPVHQGSQFAFAQRSGVESVTLSIAQMPTHAHQAQASAGTGTTRSPAGQVWAASTLGQYSGAAPTANMSASAIANAGSAAPHDNMMPYLALSFIISRFGIFPSR